MAPINVDRITRQLIDDIYDELNAAETSIIRLKRLVGMLTHYNATQDVGGEG